MPKKYTFFIIGLIILIGILGFFYFEFQANNHQRTISVREFAELTNYSYLEKIKIGNPKEMLKEEGDFRIIVWVDIYHNEERLPARKIHGLDALDRNDLELIEPTRTKKMAEIYNTSSMPVRDEIKYFLTTIKKEDEKLIYYFKFNGRKSSLGYDIKLSNNLKWRHFSLPERKLRKREDNNHETGKFPFYYAGGYIHDSSPIPQMLWDLDYEDGEWANFFNELIVFSYEIEKIK